MIKHFIYKPDAIKTFLILFIIAFGLINIGFSQPFTSNPPQDTSNMFTGVAVSPSSMHLGVKPGTTAIKEITISNDTKKINKFKIGAQDFSMNSAGKSTESTDSKYALSKMIQIIPSYIEMQAGEKAKIKLIITIPDSAAFAAWTIITIDLVNDRPPLNSTSDDKAISMGIIPSYGFGVYVYQNPPNVKNNNIEIKKFSLNKEKKVFQFEIQNIGDGIGYSTHYIELTNSKNGQQFKLPSKKFNILPNYTRVLETPIPSDILDGKYTAVGVIDFGNKDKIEAAELEFVWP